MKSIYLLNPPFVEGFCRDARWQARGRGGTLYYPIWLAYATAQLSPFCKVKLVDAVADKLDFSEVVSDIKHFEPDYIVVNTSWASLENDRRIGTRLWRTFEKAMIVQFGVPNAMNDYKLYDEIVKGKRMTLDAIPFVSSIYERFLNVEKYFQSNVLNPHVMIFSGRGCPHKCIFCSRMDGNVNMMRSLQNVLAEVLSIQTFLPQVKEILFEDATFSVDKKWVSSFCKGIVDRKIDFVWTCQVRADIPLEVLKQMKDAGCRLVICGFESGSDEMLRIMKKGTTVEQTRKFAENVRKTGILLHADFIIGLPHETWETIEETRRFIKKIAPDLLQVSVATPYPHTEFYDWLEEQGFLLNTKYLDERGFQLCRVSYPNLTSREIQDAVSETLKQYYKSWKFVNRAFSQVFRKNGFEELKRLWRSWKEFKL